MHTISPFARIKLQHNHVNIGSKAKKEMYQTVFYQKSHPTFGCYSQLSYLCTRFRCFSSVVERILGKDEVPSSTLGSSSQGKESHNAPNPIMDWAHCFHIPLLSYR